MLSRIRLLATPWTAAYQAPPSMGFSRQEYWSGVPLKTTTRYDWTMEVLLLDGSAVKNPPAKQKTQVPSLDREDPLEKKMATHSSILT